MRTAVALLFLSAWLFGADDVVFRGVPSVKVTAAAAGDTRLKVDGAEAQRSVCVVVQRGKKYFWASRDNAPLNRVDAGQFTYFLHTGGSGYIKVFRGDPKAVNAPAHYVEHISVGFETITYWGNVANRP